jgi:D-glycero-D-manno-heptose 1,7-bisphosphate phosphatase
LGKRFILIDRDGTLNEEKEYLSDPNDVELIVGAGDALKKLQDAGFGVVVITNQSGIARGYFNVAQLDRIHARLENILGEFGVRLDGIYYCPHAPDDHCDCRKPLPGLIHQAVKAHAFLPHEAWMIGDKEVDVQVGRTVGARCILVRTGYGKNFQKDTKADFVVDDVSKAADLILSSNG